MSKTGPMANGLHIRESQDKIVCYRKRNSSAKGKSDNTSMYCLFFTNHFVLKELAYKLWRKGFIWSEIESSSAFFNSKVIGE